MRLLQAVNECNLDFLSEILLPNSNIMQSFNPVLLLGIVFRFLLSDKQKNRIPVYIFYVLKNTSEKVT